MVLHRSFEIATQGKGTYGLDSQLRQFLDESGLREGLVNVLVAHTSASLVLMENADPDARRDLEEWFERAVPEDTPWFTHTCEGPDDMPSHIRMALTRSSETIPIHQGRPLLGTWQGLFLFEHRCHAHHRQVHFTAMGER